VGRIDSVHIEIGAIPALPRRGLDMGSAVGSQWDGLRSQRCPTRPAAGCS